MINKLLAALPMLGTDDLGTLREAVDRLLRCGPDHLERVLYEAVFVGAGVRMPYENMARSRHAWTVQAALRRTLAALRVRFDGEDFEAVVRAFGTKAAVRIRMSLDDQDASPREVTDALDRLTRKVGIDVDRPMTKG
jgi:hypothetical protein